MEFKRLMAKLKEEDVFHKNALIEKMQDYYKEIKYDFSKCMVKIGAYVTHSILSTRDRLKELFGKLKTYSKCKAIVILDKIGDCIVALAEKIIYPLSARKRCTEEIKVDLNEAKKHGKKAFIKALLKSVGKFYSGTGNAVSTAFNYIAPVVSIAFLIGIVNYVSGFEYGLSVEYNGQELGVVSEETDFNTATQEVQKRISYVDGGTEMDFTAKYSLKVIDNSDECVDASELANKMLNSSDAELVNAYGVYVDGEFIGAVQSEDEMKSLLMEFLVEYELDNNVTNAMFTKSVSYEEGIYLSDSLTDETDLLQLLSGTVMEKATYAVAVDRHADALAKDLGMTTEDFLALNPDVTDNLCLAGTKVTYEKEVSRMPISYSKRLVSISYMDYDTQEVETNTLYKGETAVLTAGVKGETTNVENISYVDGVETSRVLISSQVTKKPVTEEIGVGTYTAVPSSSNTSLSGNGMFCWPVNGGYVSDPFMSDRNHKGMDIAAPSGTAAYAAGSGTVIFAGWDASGYGNCVRISHGNGYVTVYAHLSSVAVAVGDVVDTGAYVGGIGMTGDATGNHLHFEVRYNGVCQNPANFIKVN